MKHDENLTGKSMMVVGVVEEHLKFNDNEWVKLRFPDGSFIEINVRHCKEIKK